MEEARRRLAVAERERGGRERALARLSCCRRRSAAASSPARRPSRSARSCTPSRDRRPRGSRACRPSGRSRASRGRRTARRTAGHEPARSAPSAPCAARTSVRTARERRRSRTRGCAPGSRPRARPGPRLVRRGGPWRCLRKTEAPCSGPPIRSATVTVARVRSSLSLDREPAAAARRRRSGEHDDAEVERRHMNSRARASPGWPCRRRAHEVPGPALSRGMSGTIGGTWGPMSAGSLSSGG